MFAVKGWSVDASALKPQTEVFGAKSDASKQSKKRKRDAHEPPAQPAARDPDVGRLWEQHIEGKKPAKKEKKAKKPKDTAQPGDVQKAPVRDDNSSRSTEQPKVDRQSEAADKDVSQKAHGVKKAKKQKSRDNDAVTEKNAGNIAPPSLPSAVPVLPKTAKLTPMQAAMRQKLVSARFRHLNETLYTAPSATAQDLFDQNPDMFEDYHAGFRQQVSVWPENPLDNFINTLKTRGRVRQHYNPKDKRHKKAPKDTSEAGGPAALPRTHGTCLVADLGCGDGRLAHTLQTSSDTTKLNLKIHSFDLHSPSSLVTKADISNVPLADGSMDVAIFCLALMGTNWIAFIEEAYRILHWKGELWIAEIKSRFGRVGRAGKPVEHSVGSKRKTAALLKAKERKEREQVEVNEQEALQTEVDGVAASDRETDVTAFIDVLRRRGFLLKEGDRSVDLGNRMFVKMEFIKAAPPTKGKHVQKNDKEDKAEAGSKQKLKFLNNIEEEPATEDEGKVLKPCLYKIR